jgi:hypothetical protein
MPTHVENSKVHVRFVTHLREKSFMVYVRALPQTVNKKQFDDVDIFNVSETVLAV